VNAYERAIPSRIDLVGHVAEGRPGAIYVGRSNMRAGLPGSIFANPWPLINIGRAECIRLYIGHALTSGAILGNLYSLRDRPLDCWCRLSDAVRDASNLCHADVLVSILARLSNAEIAALRSGATGNGTYLALNGSSITLISAPELAAAIRAELEI
jgi:hypothetical protein